MWYRFCANHVRRLVLYVIICDGCNSLILVSFCSLFSDSLSHHRSLALGRLRCLSSPIESMLLLYISKSKSMKQKFASFTPVFESPLHSHTMAIGRSWLAVASLCAATACSLAQTKQAPLYGISADMETAQLVQVNRAHFRSKFEEHRWHTTCAHICATHNLHTR